MKRRKDGGQTHPQPESQKKTITNLASDKTDPQGSYTGCPVNPFEQPVQDADDL
ncbi:MAG: hypothetical protein LKJ86_01355 [Oscillibacter sp.]|jgi:hypothetical protein|nr:hypothetical protein [Oscillibacter sp.]